MHYLRLFSAYLQHDQLVRKVLVILLRHYVYYTNRLDRVSCHLVAVYGIIVMLFDLFVVVVVVVVVFWFVCFFVDGIPMFVFFKLD